MTEYLGILILAGSCALFARFLGARGVATAAVAAVLSLSNHYPPSSLAIEYIGAPLSPIFAGLETWGRAVAMAALVGIATFMAISRGRLPMNLAGARGAVGLVFYLMVAHYLVWTLLLSRTDGVGSTQGAQLAVSYLGVAGCMTLVVWGLKAGELCAAIVAAGLTEVSLAVIQGFISWDRAFPNGRLAGTTPNAQLLAIVLAFGVVCAAFVLASRQEPGVRSHGYRWTIAIAVLASALLLTGSRGAAVGVALSTLACIPQWRRQLLMTFIVVASIAVAMELPVVQRFLVTDTAARAQVYAPAWDAFLESPVLGSGDASIQVESAFLTTAASGGLLGAAPILLLGVLAARIAVRPKRGCGARADYSLGVLLLVLSLCIAVYENAWNAKIGFNMFLNWAACALLVIRRRDEAHDARVST